MLTRPGLLLLVCLALSAVISAQQTSSSPTSVAPATSDPQAIAVLQRSLAALTGGAAVTDVTLTGTARRIAGSDDEMGTATLKATSVGDSRVELSFPSGNRIEIRNHSALPPPGSFPPGAPASSQPVGEWIGPDGSPHPIADYNIMTDAAWFFPVLTLARIATASDTVLSYVGQETLPPEAGLNGQTVLHISVSQQFPQPTAASSNAHGAPGPTVATILQHLSQMDLYLDPTSLLPVALAFNTHPNAKTLVGIPVQIRPDTMALVDIPVLIQFSNYQSANGTYAPLHVQKYLNYSLVLDLQFTTVTPNSGLSSASFQLQ